MLKHEHDLVALVNAESGLWNGREVKDDMVPDAEEVFRTLGRSVRLGRLLQRKILEPLLPGEGYATNYSVLIKNHCMLS